jgi:hemerythrin-like domain-containing protein
MAEPDPTMSLKRDPALVPLSRDHHFALMQALFLRRAAEAPLHTGRGAVTVAEAYLAYYHEELCGHIADEEEALIPLTSHVAPEQAQRLLTEHEDLRALTALLRQALADGLDPRPAMQDLGERLHDHVRFEERIFFEVIQDRLTAKDLEAVGRSILEHREARGRRAGCALPRPSTDH